MTDQRAEAMTTLKQFEQEQIERFRPKPPKPLTPAEEFAKRLDAAQSQTISVDVGWLR